MDADLAVASRLSEDEVRGRFAWGVKHGTPFWVWPAISIPKWQAALFEIERATRQILSHGRCDDPLHGEAEDIGIAAYTSGMGPLLGYWLSTGLLSAPQATEAVLKLHYRHNSARMQRLAKHASRAVAQLTAGGVKVTVVKGMHTAFAFFPAPGTRPTSDIDLIVAPEDKAAAQRILRELDYLPERESSLPEEQFWRHSSSCVMPQSLSLTHWDDPWGIDLHTSANRRYSAGSPIIRFDSLISWEAPDRWPLCQGAHVLPVAANILFVACHAGCEFTSLRMLRLVELILIIREAQRRGTLRWDEVLELGHQTATLPSAYAALKLADDLASATVPEEVLLQSMKKVPAAVIRVVAGLSPATAQRVVRCGFDERYMWASSLRGKAKQLFYDIVPANQSVREAIKILKIRFWRIARGRLTIGSSNC